MAITYVRAGGTASTKSPGTTIAAGVPAAGHATGNIIVVKASNSISGINGPTVTGIADGRGNSYFRAGGSDSALAGDTNAEIWFSILATALISGDQITVTWSVAPGTAAALGTDEFSGAGAFRSGTDVAPWASSGTQFNSGAATPPSAAQLLIAVAANHGPTGDSFVEDTDNAGGDGWHTLPKVGTSGAGASSNTTLNSAYKITTSSVSQTYDPTGTVRANVTMFVSLPAGAPPGAIPPIPNNRRASQRIVLAR